MVDGILLIDKAQGPTSHDVVARIRRFLGQRRVGHTGTLDPSATGLLVVMLGKATRLARWLQLEAKVYGGTIRFGITTDTLDAEGAVLEKRPCKFDADQLNRAVQSLVGEITQTPPAYSAVKFNGQPAHRIVRRGGSVNLKSRQVTIYGFEVELTAVGDYPAVGFEISCSSGTYIRSLAADLGAKLNCGAHLEALRRLKVGKFAVGESITLEELETTKDISAVMKSPRELLDMPEVVALPEDRQAILDGKTVSLNSAGTRPTEGTTVKIVDTENGSLIGLGKILCEIQAGQAKVKPFLVIARH